MLTGELRSQIDAIWNSFWSGGISNPLEVMEQITYLLFLRRLDDLHTLEENKSVRLNKPMERRIFPVGKDAKGRDFNDLRWSRFKNYAPAEMYTVVGEHVFPFLRNVGGDGSTYAHHMKDARFTIPTPALLSKVVDMLDHVPMEDRDTKGDLYEYMLGKIASAGQNGQFRTPRHIIKLMVELTAPTGKDVICDPASGTCGFLVAAGEYLREKHPEILRDPVAREHFHHGMFHGYDFDNTMLRIGSMNMALHGVDKARQFLREHESHLSLQRLRRNQPLTTSDLAELERMLVEAGGSPEVIKLATEQNHGLGIFIRSLVGLDRETAKQAFSQFVVGTTATASQLEFIDLIVQYLTENGTMDAARLYESPFTDINQQGPEAVFPAAKVTELVQVLEVIRERAVA